MLSPTVPVLHQEWEVRTKVEAWEKEAHTMAPLLMKNEEEGDCFPASADILRT